MGNGIAKIGVCFTGAGEVYGNLNPALYLTDEGLGHSFCYVRPDPNRIQPTGSSKIHSDDPAAGSSVFRTISGASVSANTSTNPLSGGLDPYLSTSGPLFESSTSFAAVPLQPIPRSGPLFDDDRGFMSGPIERGFLSGPLDMAGPIKRSRSQSIQSRLRPRSGSLIRGLRRVISKLGKTSVVAPVKAHQDNGVGAGPEKVSVNLSSEDSLLDDVDSSENRNLQWAQGKAGEDSVHVVVSEEHGWVFVGIYDGFNGPDATDFLLSNLYPSLQKELKGLLWDDVSSPNTANFSDQQPNCSAGVVEINPKNEIKPKIKYRGAAKKCQENQKRWKCEWDRERLELERRLNESGSGSGHSVALNESINHGKVLEAMSRGLRKTEETYFDIADKMLDESPELALMGSCVVAMLMKGEDVYVMNVGDSRAVLAQNNDTHKIDHDLERINEESLFDFQVNSSLSAFQLTMDHSTCVEQEVARIRNEHLDDAVAVVNDRVKGSLRVTRAFGAGFLKQPKWNDNLLEMFRVDYVGSSAYINCEPFLHHHRLGPKDQFLILSSDGLYQYFTNEEAVSEVELFISLSPEGDPAQHLVEEVIFRAAKKAGMDFHDLLEIPQGDRRKYHDDVSIIIISFKGRIWRSCV